jgi:hypothetical protein
MTVDWAGSSNARIEYYYNTIEETESRKFPSNNNLVGLTVRYNSIAFLLFTTPAAALVAPWTLIVTFADSSNTKTTICSKTWKVRASTRSH